MIVVEMGSVLMVCVCAMAIGEDPLALVNFYYFVFFRLINAFLLDLGQTIDVITNSTNPSARIESVSATYFSISITKLIEMNDVDEVVRSISLDSSEQNYSYSESFMGSSTNIISEYSALLENGASINITVSFSFLLPFFILY